MGGKWSFYRKMGEETVETVVKHLEGINALKKEKITHNNSEKLKLLGSFHKEENEKYPLRKSYIRFFAKYIQKNYNLEWEACKHLIKTYGVRAFDILKVAKGDKSLFEKIHKSLPIIKAEIIYQIRYEMAIKPSDIVFRRTRIGTLNHKAMFECLPTLIDIFAEVFNWNETQKESEKNKAFEDFQNAIKIEIN